MKSEINLGKNTPFKKTVEIISIVFFDLHTKGKRKLLKKGESENMSGMKIYGIYEKELYHDEESGSSRFIIRTLAKIHPSFVMRKTVIRNRKTKADENWYSIMVNAMKLNLPAYASGTPIVISGSFTMEPTEFCSESCKMQSDNESYALEFYTSACNLEYENASKIVDIYGSDINVLAGHDKTSVASAVGISEEKAARLIKKIKDTKAEQDLFIFLSKYGVPYYKVKKLTEMYEDDAINKLSQNPYLYGKRADLSLTEAEKIADYFNISPMNIDRLNYAAEIALDRIGNQGHVYAEKKSFFSVMENVLRSGIYKDFKLPASMETPSILTATETMIIDKKTVICNKLLVEAERRIYKNVLRLSEGSPLNISNEIYKKAEKYCHMTYGTQQRSAFPILLKKRGLCILTGGPGTGKTTVVKGLIKALELSYPNLKIALCAPTGRAAQRMSESCGKTASTVHRLLDIRPYGLSITCKNAGNPINADVIIVDECSMLNIELADKLLEAVKNNTLVLFVGDIHQLESVGAGNVLHDLLEADERLIPRVMLTDVFRQKGDSPIIQDAILINKGLTNLVTNQDFQIIQTHSGSESLDVVKELIKQLYNPEDPFETQILCPARTGDAGISNLNAELQELLNPDGAEIVYGKNTRYRVNDKIMMLHNNYEKQYYNGDIGIIKSINGRNVELLIRDKEYVLEKSELNEMTLAYGMTIHKSQGSEFPTVIIVMPKDEPGMLVRNLFYTAVTRGKARVIVVNEQDAMQTAIRTNKLSVRKTMLSLFFQKGKAA